MGRIVFDAAAPVADEADRACSLLTRLAAEPLVGHTAPAPQAWLLVEDPGPWGSEAAARNPRLPARLRRAAVDLGVRLQLIRRHGARRNDAAGRNDPAGTVIAAWVDRTGAWLETATASDPAALAATVDLDALAAGRRPGLGDLASDPVVLVCTHGGVDPCCAKFGRPVTRALAERFGSLVWETTHVGGCRFAANLVGLPAGVAYGHTTPELAVEQVEALLDGRLVPEGLRGHAGVAQAAQVAELAVRRRTGRWELDALTLTEHRAADGRHQTALAVDDRTFEVTVAGGPGADRPYGCGDADRWTPEVLDAVAITERPDRTPHAPA